MNRSIKKGLLIGLGIVAVAGIVFRATSQSFGQAAETLKTDAPPTADRKTDFWESTISDGRPNPKGEPSSFTFHVPVVENKVFVVEHASAYVRRLVGPQNNESSVRAADVEVQDVQVVANTGVNNAIHYLPAVTLDTFSSPVVLYSIDGQVTVAITYQAGAKMDHLYTAVTVSGRYVNAKS